MEENTRARTPVGPGEDPNSQTGEYASLRGETLALCQDLKDQIKNFIGMLDGLKKGPDPASARSSQRAIPDRRCRSAELPHVGPELVRGGHSLGGVRTCMFPSASLPDPASRSIRTTGSIQGQLYYEDSGANVEDNFRQSPDTSIKPRGSSFTHVFTPPSSKSPSPTGFGLRHGVFSANGDCIARNNSQATEAAGGSSSGQASPQTPSSARFPDDDSESRGSTPSTSSFSSPSRTHWDSDYVLGKSPPRSPPMSPPLSPPDALGCRRMRTVVDADDEDSSSVLTTISEGEEKDTDLDEDGEDTEEGNSVGRQPGLYMAGMSRGIPTWSNSPQSTQRSLLRADDLGTPKTPHLQADLGAGMYHTPGPTLGSSTATGTVTNTFSIPSHHRDTSLGGVSEISFQSHHRDKSLGGMSEISLLSHHREKSPGDLSYRSGSGEMGDEKERKLLEALVKRLKGENKKLKTETAALRIDKEDLAEKVGTLESSNARIGEELEQYKPKNAVLRTARDSLLARLESTRSFNKEKAEEADNCKAKNSLLKAENAALKTDKVNLTSEKADLIRLKDDLILEKDRLVAENANIAGEKESLILQAEDLEASIGEYGSQNSVLGAKAESLTLTIEALRKSHNDEQEEHEGVNSKLAQQIEEFKEKIQSLESEVDRLKAMAAQNNLRAENMENENVILKDVKSSKEKELKELVMCNNQLGAEIQRMKEKSYQLAQLKTRIDDQGAALEKTKQNMALLNASLETINAEKQMVDLKIAEMRSRNLLMKEEIRNEFTTADIQLREDIRNELKATDRYVKDELRSELVASVLKAKNERSLHVQQSQRKSSRRLAEEERQAEQARMARRNNGIDLMYYLSDSGVRGSWACSFITPSWWTALGGAVGASAVFAAGVVKNLTQMK